MGTKWLTAACLLLLAGAHGASDKKVRALYNSLDTRSVAQHLAFYELYAPHPLADEALGAAWQLMSQESGDGGSTLPLPLSAVESIITLVNKPADAATPQLDDDAIEAIDALAASLDNRNLRGFGVTSEAAILTLPDEEIDLCRSLLLSELGDDMRTIASYEAMIDLMALQIAARLSKEASDQEKVYAINRFVFEEQGFRFPPHSLYAKEIDQYTFLPAVLDSRRGVCLGVSILYICFAQRLGLNLEMVTPPGHIYVRCRSDDTTINIETTARGIHLNDEAYLNVNTKALQQRTMKEVIGLAHFNKGSGFCQQEKYHQALSAYQKAQQYMNDDPFLEQLIGFTYLFLGEEEKGRLHLQKSGKSEYLIYDGSPANDYLVGATDATGIKAVFMPVDATRISIAAKCRELQQITERYPRFRAGLYSLAITWLQLHRTKEATAVLERYCQHAPDDAMAHYYLAILHHERLNDHAAWRYLHATEAITSDAGHYPKALKQLEKALTLRCPE